MRRASRTLGPRLALAAALGLALHAQAARAQDAEGGAAQGGVTTTPGAAHTTSATTTRSGAAPQAAEPPRARATSAQSALAPDAAAAPPAATPPQSGSDEADHGILWIEASAGISNVNLVQFQNRNFADVAGGASVFSEAYGTGPVIGAGLGVRLFWFTLGARASFALYDTFEVGTLGAEVTLRFPIPVVEPWIRAGFGYGWQGDANYGSGVAAAQTTTYGWVFQGGVGLDVFLTDWLALGAGFGLDILNMTRQRDPSAACMSPTDVCPARDGDALGLQMKGLVTLGVHL